MYSVHLRHFITVLGVGSRRRSTCVSDCVAYPSCLIPWFDGAILSQEWKEALWDRFVMGAPRTAASSGLRSKP